MRLLPKVGFTQRARKDVRDLLRFVARQPWGRPADREAELNAAIETIRRTPTARPVRCKVAASGIGLRCCYVRPFAIIYAILDADARAGCGRVSIQAVRHWRTRNVFLGVRETGEGEASSPLGTHLPHQT